MATSNNTQPAPGIPRGLGILLTAGSGIIVVGGLRVFSDVVGPVVLALVIVVVLSPLQTRLLKRGAPKWVGAVALLAASIGVLVVIVLSLVWAAVELTQLVTGDEYADQLQDAREDLSDLLEEVGVDVGAESEADSEAASDAQGEAESEADSEADSAAASETGSEADSEAASEADSEAASDAQGEADSEASSVLDSIDLKAISGQLVSLLSGLLGLLSALSMLVFTMVFLVMDSTKFQRNLDYVAGQRATFAEALDDFASDTRSYFFVSTVFGLIVAALDVVALLILGIPLALVWGLLAFITNYIPNVGFIIGLIPPALLAYFQGGLGLSLWVIVIYTVLNVVIQSIIQPRVVGDAVGLSATLSFLSLLFWGWVIGPIGALLAIPLTLLAKLLLIDMDPSTRWVEPLITLQDPEKHPASSDPLAQGDDKEKEAST